MTITMPESRRPGLFYKMLTWLKRATGIGYHRFGPLVGNEVDVDRSIFLRLKSDELARDVEQLERELRKLGIRIPADYRFDH